MLTVELDSWDAFRRHIDNDREIMPVYWRGQRVAGWPLASQFERWILRAFGGSNPGASQIYPYDGRYGAAGARIWAPGFYQHLRDRYLARYKHAAAGARGPNPARLEEDEWWALGRHHGLVTPLLDWTESPYIAAFFPMSDIFAEASTPAGIFPPPGHFSVFRLFDSGHLEGDGLRVLRPVVDELGRMQRQRGLFTWLDSEDYFELQGFMDNTGRENLLTQFVIPNVAMFEGLRDLKKHGIDYALIFPDLIGAALHANTDWNIW